MGIKNNLLQHHVGGIFLPLVLLIFFSVSLCILSEEKSSPPTPRRNVGAGNVEKQTDGKIGFADFLTIYHSYSRTEEEDERLKEKGNEIQAKLDLEKGKIAELEKKMNSGILSETEKGKLSKEMEEVKMQVNKKIQEFNLEIESDRRKTIDKLIEELREKISNFGKEKSYSMILDKNELIFSDTSFDLTKEIVNYINKESSE